jgi:hypothetical protein
MKIFYAKSISLITVLCTRIQWIVIIWPPGSGSVPGTVNFELRISGFRIQIFNIFKRFEEMKEKTEKLDTFKNSMIYRTTCFIIGYKMSRLNLNPAGSVINLPPGSYP